MAAQKITTLVYLPLAADASLDSALKAVKSIDGVGQVYYGRELENPDIVDLAIDWVKPSSCNKLLDSVLAGEVYNALKPKLTGTPTIFNVQHSYGPGTFLDAKHNPVTEIATMYLLPNADDATVQGFDNAFAVLENAVLAQPGVTTADAGYVVGLLNNPTINVEVKTFIATVGWVDPQAHINFTKTPAFASSLGGLVPYLSGNADHHVYFKKA